jgi:hypothetical protein
MALKPLPFNRLFVKLYFARNIWLFLISDFRSLIHAGYANQKSAITNRKCRKVVREETSEKKPGRYLDKLKGETWGKLRA